MYCYDCKYRECKREATMEEKSCIPNDCWVYFTKHKEISGTILFQHLYVIKCCSPLYDLEDKHGPGLPPKWFWGEWNWGCISYIQENPFVILMKDVIFNEGQGE